MLNFFLASLNRIVAGIIEGVLRPRWTNLVYRDDIRTKVSANKAKNRNDHCLPSRGEEDSKNLAKGNHGRSSAEEKEGIRVKVKMTKEEAARLMSKCKEGGILDFKDAAHELVQIPVNRVSVVSSGRR